MLHRGYGYGLVTASGVLAIIAFTPISRNGLLISAGCLIFAGICFWRGGLRAG